MKFLCDQCKAKYQIADDKVVGKTVRMKCRKCGHQIEVRAAVTETSVAGAHQNELDRTLADPASGQPAPRSPAAPRAPRPATAPLATSLASARAPRPAAPPASSKGESSLASAFQRNVHGEDGTSPGLRELSPNDDWYVAINGVPVGPIRIGEVRRKAAVGAVTEDSLVWQEGLDEWRQVRTFPDLAEAVREAATSGRSSLISSPPSAPPPPPAPPSEPRRGQNPLAASQQQAAKPAPPRAAPAFAPRPAPPPERGGFTPRAPAAQAAMASANASGTARSNVVPIASRLATAERLDEAIAPPAAAFAPPAPLLPRDLDGATGQGMIAPNAASVPVVAAMDPFAAPPPAPNGGTSPFTSEVFGPAVPGWSAPAERPSAIAAIAAPAPIVIETPARKTPPWLVIAMLVLAAAFGITAALAVFLRPAQPVNPVVIQMSASPNGAPMPTGTATAAPQSTADLPPSPTSTSRTGGPLATGPAPKGTAAAAGTASAAGALDLGGLGEGRTQIAEDPNNPANAPRPAGQCLSEAQVMNVINIHQAGVRRVCWDQSPSTKSSVNISVSLTIGGGGGVEAASAGGDDNSVASCVAQQVRRWSFPAMWCQQKTAFGYHFIR